MEKEVANKRWNSIDRFRGLIVFCMIFFQACEHFPILGKLGYVCSHDVETGIVLFGLNITLADLVAPMFFLAIGFTMIMSFKKRLARDGKKEAYKHFIIRGLAITGFGGLIWTMDNFDGLLDFSNFSFKTIVNVISFIFAATLLLFFVMKFVGLFLKKCQKYNKLCNNLLTYGAAIFGLMVIVLALRHDTLLFAKEFTGEPYAYWQVLCAIGFACILCTPFLNTKPAVRLLGAFAYLAFFNAFHQTTFGFLLLDIEVQGGFLGSFSWSVFMLVGSVIIEGYFKDRETKGFPKWTALTIVLAIISGLIGSQMYINKGSVSPGYVLFCMPLILAFFYFFALFENVNLKFDFLGIWGKSPLIMFMCQYLFVSIFCFAIDVESWPLYAVIIYLSVLVIGLTGLNFVLAKKGKIIRL